METVSQEPHLYKFAIIPQISPTHLQTTALFSLPCLLLTTILKWGGSPLELQVGVDCHRASIKSPLLVRSEIATGYLVPGNDRVETLGPGRDSNCQTSHSGSASDFAE